MLSDALGMENRREWAAACDVQQRFMQHPVRAIDFLDYSARCRQVHELGGDCYDFVPLADRRLALAVGDASGRGLAAALMISNVQSSLRTAALFSGDDPAGRPWECFRRGPTRKALCNSTRVTSSSPTPTA
jgi:serine phosphatase RsbU (regulator of sigma subunit)